jgi:hypothetical protein
MFEGCTSLTSIPSLSSVTEVGNGGCEYMFEGCTSLTSVSIPNISSYDDYAFNAIFKNCTNLNDVTCLIEHYNENDNNSDAFY